MKKTLIALIALACMSSVYAGELIKDDFADGLNELIFNDVASELSSGTFAFSFSADSLMNLNLLLAMGGEGNSFPVALASNSSYLSMTAPGVDLFNSYLFPVPSYSGDFVVQSVNSNECVSVTLSYLNGENFVQVHTISTYSDFPSEINNAKLVVASGSDPISELRIWKGVVTAQDIKNAQSAPAPAVPEPTTATLSLLALAGLAARRRRK